MARNRVRVTGVAVEDRPSFVPLSPDLWMASFTLVHRLGDEDGHAKVWIPVVAFGDLAKKVKRCYIEWGEVDVVGSIYMDDGGNLSVRAHHVGFVRKAKFRKQRLLWRRMEVQDLNEFVLSGVVADEPFFRGGGRPMAAVTLKVSYGDDGANYIRVVAFGDLASRIYNSVSEGTQLSVKGRLSTYKRDGKSVLSAVASSFEVIGAGKQDEELPF